ncbi:MAG: single-stranded DNA-binding protein [Propionibacteriaceae bacterium]
MEAYVHMTGYVGGDVEFRNNTVATASFRLACTPRIRRGGDWTDGETTWQTITCFRSLAENAASSVRKGDPVIVIGRLRTQVWNKDGIQQERTVLEALTIGHDLTRGTSAFNRNERVPVPEDRESEVVEVITSVESQSNFELELDDPRRETQAA